MIDFLVGGTRTQQRAQRARILSENNAFCPYCDQEEEGMMHIVSHCTVWRDIRGPLIQKYGVNIGEWRPAQACCGIFPEDPPVVESQATLSWQKAPAFIPKPIQSDDVLCETGRGCHGSMATPTILSHQI